MCMELSEEGIPQRTARPGEVLQVRAMKGNPNLIALVSADDPVTAVHPSRNSVVRVSGIPESRQPYWGKRAVAKATCAPFNPAESCTDYDAFIFDSDPNGPVDLRAFVQGMTVTVLHAA